MTTRGRVNINKREAQFSDGSPQDQPDDYTIYPQMDGIKVTANWRLRSYGDVGALSKEGVSTLVHRFQLLTPIVETLSQQLGYCLDTASRVHLVAVNRATSIKRANAPLEKAARLAKRIEADIKNLNRALEKLTVDFAHSQEDANLLVSAKRQASASFNASTGLHDAIDLVIQTPGAAADMSPRNKTGVRDKRRQVIVETCCYAWRDAGRHLTYTTVSNRPKSEQRQGKLVDFIQEVVAQVTDPSQHLSTETIRKDIDRLKTQLAAPGQVLMPPIKG